MVLATSRHSDERLGHLSYFMSTGPCYKQLHESLGNVRLIATVAVPRPGCGTGPHGLAAL